MALGSCCVDLGIVVVWSWAQLCGPGSDTRPDQWQGQASRHVPNTRAHGKGPDSKPQAPGEHLCDVGERLCGLAELWSGDQFCCFGQLLWSLE